MREFVTAVVDHDGLEEDSNVYEFKLDGRELRMHHPSTGQLAIMSTMIRGEMDRDGASNFIALFFSMFDHEDRVYLQDRLMDRNDGFDIDSEGGMFDIFSGLLEDVSASRPPASPTDYQEKRKPTGRGSTGTTRAKASTSSTTRSRASSR